MKRTTLYLLIIIAFSIVLRLPTFLGDFVNIDENEYAIAAQKILAGGYHYKDFLNYQPPVIHFLYALGFCLSGGTHIWSAQMLAVLFVIGTIVTLFYLASAVTGSRQAGLASALAYGVFSTTFIPQDMLAANCEIFMMLLLTLSVLALYYAEKRGSYLLYLLTGLFASAGLMTKYQGGVVIAAEVLYLLIISKKKIIPAFFLAIGALIPVVTAAAYLWKGGALPYALESLQYIFLYAKGPVQSDPIYVLLKFASRTLLFIIPGIIMWYGAVAVIPSSLRALHFRAFCVLWFLVSFIPVIVGGRIYFHYFFTPLPPAALLFGIWWDERGRHKGRAFKTAFATWLIICAVGWAAYATYLPFKGHGRKDKWIPVSTYLKEHASAGETLFVWGCAPQIYIGSGLKNDTRFVTADYLTGRSPMTAGLEYDPKGKEIPSSWKKFVNDFVDPPGVVIFDTSANIFPKAWQYLREDFEKGLPTYIVDTAPSNYRRYGRYPIENYPYLADIIRKNYKLMQSLNGFDLYKIR